MFYTLLFSWRSSARWLEKCVCVYELKSSNFEKQTWLNILEKEELLAYLPGAYSRTSVQVHAVLIVPSTLMVVPTTFGKNCPFLMAFFAIFLLFFETSFFVGRANQLQKTCVSRRTEIQNI